jgi:arylformamidase
VEFFDISQTLQEGIAVWPGDPEFRMSRVSQIQDGKGANVSAFQMGTHTGTHLDAPLHLDDAGSGVEGIPLHQLIGPARVFEFNSDDGVRASDLASLDLQGITRVLFKAAAGEMPESLFNRNYVFLHEDAAEYLAEQGIVLLGVNAPSVDAWNNESLPIHQILLKHKIIILEGLRLGSVPPGDYELICLPLKLAGCDGAPVRAILREYVSNTSCTKASKCL